MKKGFTLIELLAVIVILAIIAVITVPKIADMILSSRMGGAEDSFYGTLKAAELGYTKALQSKTDLKGDICDLSKTSGDKVTCTNGTILSFTGKVPEKGTLIINSTGSTIAKEITLNGYKCYGDLSTKNPCVKTTDKVANETLISKVTTTGQGLYLDSANNTLHAETKRYIYKGANPDNYVYFNGEEWRIVAVENDGAIKIVKTSNFTSRFYDDSSRNNKENSYCLQFPESQYWGCNVWSAITGTYTNGKSSGTVTKDSALNTYLNTTYFASLNSAAKDSIQSHASYIGRVSLSTLDTLVSNQKAEELYSWSGNVALLQSTDYLKATTNTACINAISSQISPYPCGTDNYLYMTNVIGPWTLNPYPDFPSVTTNVDHTNGRLVSVHPNDTKTILPVVYLKANTILTGSGTSSNPYKIA